MDNEKHIYMDNLK